MGLSKTHYGGVCHASHVTAFKQSTCMTSSGEVADYSMRSLCLTPWKTEGMPPSSSFYLNLCGVGEPKGISCNEDLYAKVFQDDYIKSHGTIPGIKFLLLATIHLQWCSWLVHLVWKSMPACLFARQVTVPVNCRENSFLVALCYLSLGSWLAMKSGNLHCHCSCW